MTDSIGRTDAVKLTAPEVFPRPMRVVFVEEGMRLDLIDVRSSEAPIACGQEVADQVHTARAHADLVRELERPLVVHDVAVSAHQGLREEGAFANLEKKG